MDKRDLGHFPVIDDYAVKIPLSVKDVLSEIEAEYAYFQTTRPKQHKKDSFHRLEQNVQLLQNYINSFKLDIED